MHISGDRYATGGTALVEIERRAEGFYFHWEASDSEGTDVAADSKTILFTTIDTPSKPYPYLEQYIRTNIQKTRLKRKNRLKVTAWSWIEK